MAENINTWLDNILTARYGEDVRQSIYKSIKLFDEEVHDPLSTISQNVQNAVNAATNAEASKEAAQQAATNAEASKEAAQQAATNAEASKTAAQQAATNAAENAEAALEPIKDAIISDINDAGTSATNTAVATVVQAGDTVATNILNKTEEAIAAVVTQEENSTEAIKTAEEEAVQKIGDTVEDLLNDPGNLYVKKTGDDITGVVTAPTPTSDADPNQIVNVNYLKNNVPTVAKAAEKLETPREIELNGAVNGKGSFDGSEDIKISTTFKTGSAVSNMAGWAKVGHLIPVYDYNNYTATFLVQNQYPNLIRAGLLTFNIRCVPNVTVPYTISLEWIVATYTINPAHFVIAYPKNDAKIIELWVYIDQSYANYRFTLLQEEYNWRPYSHSDSWVFKVYDDNISSGSIPDDYEQISSTLSNFSVGELHTTATEASADDTLIWKKWSVDHFLPLAGGKVNGELLLGPNANGASNFLKLCFIDADGDETYSSFRASLINGRVVISLGGYNTQNNILRGIGNPKEGYDASNKNYVDDRFFELAAPNAGAHNGIFRGKNLGTSITTAQYAAIAEGTFDDLYIGDFWTIDGTVWRIAAFDYYYRVGSAANLRFTKHHILLLADAPKGDYAKIADTINSSAGTPFASSNVYLTALPAIATTIKNDFGASHVGSFYASISSITNGIIAERPTQMDACILNEIMITGNTRASGDFNFGASANMRIIISTDRGQLPLFHLAPEYIATQNFVCWTRTAASNSKYCAVSTNGCIELVDTNNAYTGTRPYFCLVGD